MLVKNALDDQIKTISDNISRRLIRLRLQENTAANQTAIKELADERQLLRRLLWKPAFTELMPEERRLLSRLVPQAIEAQSAILADAEMLIFEGYKFDETTGVVAWTIDKKADRKGFLSCENAAPPHGNRSDYVRLQGNNPV